MRHALGLSVSPGRATPAERGVAELMVKVHRDHGAALSQETLCDWHGALMRERRGVRIGAYRTHPAPMRVVSGRLDRPTVHFEAPPSTQVPREMECFLEWFNAAIPAASRPLGGLARAGMAHLHFESIHPFDDGNGRIGRAVSERALAQAIGRPTLIALAATILRRRAEYYRELAAANQTLEISGWLAWFAGAVLEAQQRARASVQFVLARSRLLGTLDGRVNERQMRVLLRMLREGVDGFTGGLCAANYMSIAGTTTATATRDLAGLVDLGALSRTGERKGTRYHLSIAAAPVPRISVDGDGRIVETHAGDAPRSLAPKCLTRVPRLRRYGPAMPTDSTGSSAPSIDIDSLFLIVVGAHPKAEHSDRPIAYMLRQHVAKWLERRAKEDGDAAPVLTPLVVTDVWYLNDNSLRRCPAVSVGAPGVNALSAYLGDKVPSAYCVDECFMVQMDLELHDLIACCWGVSTEATALAVDAFIQRYAQAFLDGAVRASVA